MKKIGMLDGRRFAQATSDAFNFVETGGAAYPQMHGALPKDVKKIMGPLQKKPPKKERDADVVEVTDTVQLWEDYVKRSEALVKRYKDRALKAKEGDMDKCLHKMEQANFKIQTYIFPKSYGLDRAKAWLKERGSSTTVDETEESFRFRQADPGGFVRMRTVDRSNPSFKWLPAGVKVVVGPTKKREARRASIIDSRIFPTVTALAREED